MANAYVELKNKHHQEVSDFPIMFAFSDSQFKEGMEELGLTEGDTDKIYSIGGGGYIRRADTKAFNSMFARHEQEMQSAIDRDSTGENFIYEMFNYELANHEYSYTRELDDTLDALGISIDEINSNERLLHGLKLACKNQESNDCW